VQLLASSPDGKALTSVGRDGSACIWDLSSGKQRRHFSLGFRGMLLDAALCAPARLLAASEQFGDTVILMDLTTGKEIRRIRVAGSKGSMLALSADGFLLATGSIGLTNTPEDHDYALHVWEVLTGGEILRLHPGSTTVTALAFAPDGRTLTSGMANGTALVWDLVPRPTTAKQPSEKELTNLWNTLGERDAARAYQALWTLAASPGQAVPLIKERLRPATGVDMDRVRRLIADLDSDRFAARESAYRELEQLGEAVRPLMRQVLAGQPSLEKRRRLQNLLDAGPEVLSAGALRGIRAVRVLEYMACPEAHETLQALAKGAAEARLTREAKASLERLARRRPKTP
jgi:hypothetical protein